MTKLPETIREKLGLGAETTSEAALALAEQRVKTARDKLASLPSANPQVPKFRKDLQQCEPLLAELREIVCGGRVDSYCDKIERLLSEKPGNWKTEALDYLRQARNELKNLPPGGIYHGLVARLEQRYEETRSGTASDLEAVRPPALPEPLSLPAIPPAPGLVPEKENKEKLAVEARAAEEKRRQEEQERKVQEILKQQEEEAAKLQAVETANQPKQAAQVLLEQLPAKTERREPTKKEGPPRKNRALLWGALAVALILLAGLIWKSRSGNSPPANSQTPKPTVVQYTPPPVAPVQPAPVPPPPSQPKPETPVAPPVQTGSVSVQSTPSGAVVIQNNMELGRTPLIISDVPPGEVQFTLRLSNYGDVQISGTVSAGQQLNLSGQLQLAAAEIIIDSSPLPQNILLNGSPVASVSPPVLVLNNAGDYAITVEATGYLPVTKNVTVTLGETNTVEFGSLVPEGYLTISCDDPQAPFSSTANRREWGLLIGCRWHRV